MFPDDFNMDDLTPEQMEALEVVNEFVNSLPLIELTILWAATLNSHTRVLIGGMYPRPEAMLN